jgi:ubiquinone/menaquinone biosynthesis C-methylase UbiE
MPDFDRHVDTYQRSIDHGIGFIGVEHDVYLRAKAAVLFDLFNQVGPPKSLSVLDVGCGIGAFSKHIVSRVGELHGVDVSGESIVRAAQALPNGVFTAYDGSRLPFSDGRFDVAFAVCVFHHVDRRDRPALAAELRRVVRPGGLVAVFEHNPWNPLTRLVVRRVTFDEGVELLTAKETCGLLRNAQLEEVSSRFILFAPSAAGFVTSMEKRLGRLPLGAQYVAVGRR